MKFNKNKKEKIERENYYKLPKDYTKLAKAIKYICISMIVLIFVMAVYQVILKDDTSEVEKVIEEAKYYINKTDFTNEDSLKSFAESFTDLYLSSEIEGKERKELMSRYVSNYSDFQIKLSSNVSMKVKSTKLRKVEEVSDELLNVSVLARVEIITNEVDKVTKNTIKRTKIKDYILKLPIKVTKPEYGEFLYLIYKSPSFEPLPLPGEEYQGKFIKLTQMSPVKTSVIENTVKSFLKVYFEGTDAEIEYFYIGSKVIKGFEGDLKLERVTTKVYEMKGSENLIAYSTIEVSDLYGTYKNSYELKLTEKGDKWYIRNFDIKDSDITRFENEED